VQIRAPALRVDQPPFAARADNDRASRVEEGLRHGVADAAQAAVISTVLLESFDAGIDEIIRLLDFWIVQAPFVESDGMREARRSTM
jgi:hypothetical protein